MNTPSTYLKLSNYALLEWVYNTDEKSTLNNTFYKISNIDKKISVVVSDNRSSSFTKNVLDHTFIEIDGGRVGHCDIDQTFELHELDPNIDLNTNLNIPEYLVKYDTIRLHILAGYNLQGTDGIGLRISADQNSGTEGILSSFIYELSDNTLKTNTKPFSVGEQVYDKYIEIKVPSLSDLNQKYYSLATPTNKQLAYYLSDGSGFKKESPIKIKFYIFSEFEEIDNKLTFFYNIFSETSLPQIDPNSLLTNTIIHSDEGDYFEYYTLYDGNFIADYISLQNSLGYVMTIVNEIRVFENYSNLTTKMVQEFPYIQDEDFDKPNIFRPVISNEAISFYIEYTARIVNQTENTQIFRTSSISCDSKLARKYGKRLQQLMVKDTTNPFKLYNYKSNSEYNLTINKVPVTPVTYQTSIVRYTKEYELSLTSETKIPNIENQNTIPQIIMGNGYGNIYISEFDNYLKFTFYKKTNSQLTEKVELKNLIVGNDTIALIFYNTPETKTYIYGKLEGDEIIFNIPKNISMGLKNTTNNRFNIIYINSIKEEISLYEGFFTMDYKQYQDNLTSLYTSTLDKKIEDYRKIYEDLNKKIKALRV